MPYVLEIIRNKGQSPNEADSYVEVLRDALEQLEGDRIEEGAVAGIDFWGVGTKALLDRIAEALGGVYS